MVDFKKLLDAVVAAIGRGDSAPASPRGRASAPIESAVDQASSQLPQLLHKAKDLAAANPGLTQAALVGLAGLLFKNRKGGLSSGIVKLGGLAVIGALAYKAVQSRRGTPADDSSALPAPFHASAQNDDDARLLLRTMIAAAAADGTIDETERARIVKGMNEAGVDADSGAWLRDEIASPAEIDELAEAVNDRDRAAQVYAAARIVIDPDTLQEREFLRRLAEALDLDAPVLKDIDDAVSALR